MLPSMDRHADNTLILKKFCVPVSTGTSKVNKLLKIPPDSITEGLIFQISLGHAPRPPSAVYCTL